MIKKRTSSILIGFLATLLLFACSAEENITQSSTNQAVDKAKNWFESGSNTSNLKIIEYTKEIQWDKAIVTNGEKGQIIEVPITLVDFVNTANTANKKLNDYHRLLFIKGSKETYACYDLQIFTSDSHFDNLDKNFNYYSIKDDFNGFVTIYDPVKKIAGSQKFKNGKRPNPNITAKLREEAETCTYLVWIYEDGSTERITLLYCTGSGGAEGPGGPTGGYGGNGGSPTVPSTNTPTELNPCAKIKKLIDDQKHKDALTELKNNFKLQYETGYYISKSQGYVAGTPDSNLALTGTRYSDSYGIMHVHEDTFTHQVNNGGIRPEIVTPIHMFSPKDVNTFCSLLITANKYKTSSLDEVFNEMVSSSGTYQLRFEGDINNVKNFNYDDLEQKYIAHMKDYKDDLESGFLSFMKEYIGINGITLYKINEDGTSESKTLSANNQLTTNPC
jgi:hypothetical protein